MIVRPPPPQLTISSPEEYDRARDQLAQLDHAKRGSVEEAIRVGLIAAINAWRARQEGVRKPLPDPK